MRAYLYARSFCSIVSSPFLPRRVRKREKNKIDGHTFAPAVVVVVVVWKALGIGHGGRGRGGRWWSWSWLAVMVVVGAGGRGGTWGYMVVLVGVDGLCVSATESAEPILGI